jgi:Putative bacterial sensory transduction regulator
MSDTEASTPAEPVSQGGPAPAASEEATSAPPPAAPDGTAPAAPAADSAEPEVAPPVDPETMRHRVQDMLTKIVRPIQVDSFGAMSFTSGSTRVYVRVQPFNETSIVNVSAITNVGLTASPELYEYVATHADDWSFGHVGIRDGDGGMEVVFRYSLLGDFVSAGSLEHAVGAVAQAADQIDDDVAKRFGGHRARDIEVQTPPPPIDAGDGVGTTAGTEEPEPGYL